jgi:3-methyladenine DNA glycosylase AlkD
MIDAAAAAIHATARLRSCADPNKAAAMQRYMKTDMPFLGVQKPDRVPILRELVKGWVPDTRNEYETLVTALWELPHREEKYLALGVARAHSRFVTRTSVPLFRRLIVSGAWWDFVDEVATKLTGRVLLKQRSAMTPTIESWLVHHNMWVRRSAMLAQIGHKAETDRDLLFRSCLTLAPESEFFIRKAIGWALRDYAWTMPDAVRDFVDRNGTALSGLSRREATKNL